MIWENKKARTPHDPEREALLFVAVAVMLGVLLDVLGFDWSGWCAGLIR